MPNKRTQLQPLHDIVKGTNNINMTIYPLYHVLVTKGRQRVAIYYTNSLVVTYFRKKRKKKETFFFESALQ